MPLRRSLKPLLREILGAPPLADPEALAPAGGSQGESSAGRAAAELECAAQPAAGGPLGQSSAGAAEAECGASSSSSAECRDGRDVDGANEPGSSAPSSERNPEPTATLEPSASFGVRERLAQFEALAEKKC